MLDLTGAAVARAAAMLDPGVPAGGFRWMAESVVFTTAMPAVDVLYLYPFRVLRRMSVTSISQRVQAGQAGAATKCAVWANDPTKARPTGLPMLGQNVGFDATASLTNRTAMVPATDLPEGVYWGGTVATASGTPPTLFHQGTPPAALHVVSSFAELNFAGGFYVAQPYANDIMARDLTSATLMLSTGLGQPIVALGWS